MERITSAANPAAKRLKALSDSKARRRENMFLVEGEVMIEEAISSGLTPVEALFENESPLLQSLISLGAEARLCTRGVIESVCDTKTPQGSCASFLIPSGEIPKDAALLIALDSVQDPGNLGTIIRTADASGFDGVILSPACADLYSPKVQRSAMGSGFRIKTKRLPLCDEISRLKELGFKAIVSALDGQDLYSSEAAIPRDRLILVIGNEANGVNKEVQALSDIKLKIPMRGRAESLNAAVAAGILMYELTRPRR